MYTVLMNALLEMCTTVLTRLSVQFCVFSLANESHDYAVLNIPSRFSALHLLIAPQKTIVFTAGKSLFTEALDAAPGNLIDQ